MKLPTRVACSVIGCERLQPADDLAGQGGLCAFCEAEASMPTCANRGPQANNCYACGAIRHTLCKEA